MNKEEIEELAFKDRKELANLNELDLLEIIEFLQNDRKQWINQFTQTHNESIDIQKENQELKSQLKGTTHCFDEEEHEKLKKQLEEWKQHLKCAKEMLDMQGQKGNYDYDEYMLGLYNGMEYIISLFETREPNYISGKDIKFINNKTQQKEFIKYMNDIIEDLETEDVDDEEMKGYLLQRISTFKEILSKFKEITGQVDGQVDGQV